MLILNAPGFFSMFWGLIKKFVDPRTAQRIQVFSSREKGLAALRKLVAVEEIPVDYGGTNKSVKQAFMEEAADPLLKRQDIELVHVNRKGKTSATMEWKLTEDEYLQIGVYTRSVSAATVTVEFNGDVYATGTAAAAAASNIGSDGLVALPKCNVIVQSLQGPGTVRVGLSDLDNADKKVNGNRTSRGYFLLVCDVRQQD
jgi:hypothetical protein